MVPRTGIEPVTQGFSVLCSTNWAMAPHRLCCDLRCKDRPFLAHRQIFLLKSVDKIFIYLFYSLFIVMILPSSSYINGMTFRLRSHVVPLLGTQSWWNRYHWPLYSAMLWWVVQPTTGSRITPLKVNGP